MSVRLFVGNLPYSVTEDDVRDHFATIGPVASVKIPVDRETGRSRGFAFVEYADRALAEEAIRRLHNQPLGGRNLAVNEAKPPDRTGGPPPRRDGPPGSGFSPRPGGPPPGRFDGPGGPPRMGPPGGPRPSGPPGSGPPRPGGFRGDAPPSFDADPFGGGRGFDSPPRRPKKAPGGNRGGKKWTDRERAPKGPLQERGGGRFYSVDDAEEDLENLGDEFEDIFTDEDGEVDEAAEPAEPEESDEAAEPAEPAEPEESDEPEK